MDLDPFEPAGIGAPAMRFLDIFLLHCLLSDSAPDTPEEIAALGRNQHRAAAGGREPGLRLERFDAGRTAPREVMLSDWAAEILAQCVPIAAALDAAHDGGSGAARGRPYREALAAASAALAAPHTLPSARVLATMRQEFDSSYTAFVRAMSEQTRAHFAALPWSAAQQQAFETAAAQSLARQAAIEAADQASGVDFETWRRAYLDAARLLV